MKSSEIVALIEANRENILAAMKEADRTAYKHTACKYIVALFPDGHTEEREKLAGDNWVYMNDPAVAEVASFCYEYYSVLEDSYLSYGELINDLENECTDEEKAAYKKISRKLSAGAA